MRFFLYRKLPEEFQGTTYIWDVDKTYLNTPFESLGGMIQIFFEFAIDKKAIAGAKELLRELRRGSGESIEIQPIFFISASPVQLKRILEKKFLLDGIQHDGIILKDYVYLWRYQKIRFKNNFPYKLISLLNHRLKMPKHSREILFGDDFENDSDTYSIYADILSKDIDEDFLKEKLLKYECIPKEIEIVLDLKEKLKNVHGTQDVVEKIFIHVVKNKDLTLLASYGDRLVLTENYLQTAKLLYEMGKISKAGLQRIAYSFSKSA